MAIGIIANLGSSGEVDTSKKYLYKDGVQKVAWDFSTSVPITSGWTSDGTFVAETNNLRSTVTTSNHSRCLFTQDAIELTAYSKLNAIINNSTEISLDISSILGVAYIELVSRLGGSTTYFSLCVMQNKSYSSQYAGEDTSLGSTTTVVVNRIWLEK